MPPIEENQNTAPDVPLGSETASGSAPLPAVVSDTAASASQSTTDSVPETEAAPDAAPQVALPIETASETQPVPVAAPVVVKRNDVREFLVMAMDTIRGKKAKKLTKIMAMLEKTGAVTNDQVEKLLHCSHATATRYLDILEKEGKVVQRGKIGHAVKYSKA